ncbi:MAG: GH92 family glycosyl hydrolase [Muribaculaceae bacterium]|nr:GH92 family glycosyl hydrolase [Muribaculaceae bacterium]
MTAKIVLATVCLSLFSGMMANDYAGYVDPFIGTGAVEGGLSGNNYPGATAPFGMVQLSPDTHPSPDWFNASGYDYNDSIIYSFSHTRLSGTGASDFIDIGFFPTTGRAESSRFSHDRESASPGYYSVQLLDEDIRAELAATERVGVHRYTYPSGKSRNLIIDMDHSANKGSWNRMVIQSQIRQTGPRTIEGFRVITGWAKLRKIYFLAEFSEDITGLAIADGGEVRHGATVVNGRSLKAAVEFGTGATPVVAKVALSGVSVANARLNMQAEASHFDFDGYVASGRQQWNEALGVIEAEGTPERLRTFYTALYHTMIQPNAFSDVNGQYMTPSYSVGQLPDGDVQYSTFSLWDTYRAAHPLYAIIMPERDAAFVNSMIRHYADYGYLPVWHIWGQDNYCMIGNHAIPVIADAVLRDLPGIDAEAAYEAVRESSLQSHLNSPFDLWETYGYMPETLQSQSVSITLEMAFDDWCVAQMAEKLGKHADYGRFMARSQYFRNLYDSETGFFRAKDESGKWTEPFDPLKFGANGGYPFTEGNAWQYSWYVPHDVPALVELNGGKKAFEKKLDTFFTLNDTSGEKNDNISGCIGQYAHGNEPSHHVAYLYNYAGASHKTQRMVRRIMDELYNNTSSGYAGNDDCGEMSAWYVFSAMGFYPVNPASGEYSLGTPLFDRCTVHLPSGSDFVITAARKSPDDYAVKSVWLNGRRHKSTTLEYKDIVAGGNLHFEL